MPVPKSYAKKIREMKKKEEVEKAKKKIKEDKEFRGEQERIAEMRFRDLEVFIKELDVEKGKISLKDRESQVLIKMFDMSKGKISLKEVEGLGKAYISAIVEHGGPKSKEAQAVLAKFKKLLQTVK